MATTIPRWPDATTDRATLAEGAASPAGRCRS
jgi:hypothetical protein